MKIIETTVSVLGQPVAAATYRQAYRQVEVWARKADAAYLVEAANSHVIAMARHDADFGETIRSFDLVLPDGMPLLWTMNQSLASPLDARVRGPELMLRCMNWSRDARHLKHYLFGSSEEVLGRLERRLRDRYPGVKIVGRLSPPFGTWSDEENEQFIEQIRRSDANLIWVGLGCPKQERWISRNRDKLPHGVYFGVGAAFPLNAGLMPEAPDWMQRWGLEWLFRLLMEPRRLWKRYLNYNLLFLFYLVTDRLRGK